MQQLCPKPEAAATRWLPAGGVEEGEEEEEGPEPRRGGGSPGRRRRRRRAPPATPGVFISIFLIYGMPTPRPGDSGGEVRA